MEYITIVWYEAGHGMYAPYGYVWYRDSETALFDFNERFEKGMNVAITRHGVHAGDTDSDIQDWIETTLIPVFPTWKTSNVSVHNGRPGAAADFKALSHRNGCRLEGKMFKASEWAGHVCNGVQE